MSSERVSFSRKELYERVWSTPIARFASELGVSDVAVAKACRKLGVPTPPRGYWARLAAKQKVRRSPLPAARLGVPGSWSFERRAPRAAASNAAPRLSQPLIEVPDELDAPHPLVRASAQVLSKLKPDQSGLLRGSQARCLSIDVSPASRDRALRIMDALLKRLEAQGTPIEALPPEELHVWTPGASVEPRMVSLTRACIDGEWLPFCLEEELKAEELPKPVGIYSRAAADRWLRTPTARLSVRIRRDLREHEVAIGHRGSWADAAKQRLENVLHHVVDGLRDAAAATKQARQRAEQQRTDREAHARAFAAQQAAEREDAERQKHAEELVPRWRLAKDLRAYIADVRAIVADAGLELTPGGETEDWLNWCDAYAKRIDPLTHFHEEVARVKAKTASNKHDAPDA